MIAPDDFSYVCLGMFVRLYINHFLIWSVILPLLVVFFFFSCKKIFTTHYLRQLVLHINGNGNSFFQSANTLEEEGVVGKI